MPLVFTISIPAFREEGDQGFEFDLRIGDIFQSPPSVRKATLGYFCNNRAIPISIPAFREEGDQNALALSDRERISIPAFREEGDSKFQQEIAKTQGIKQPFLQTVTRTHFLAGKNPKVD